MNIRNYNVAVHEFCMTVLITVAVVFSMLVLLVVCA
jgi:hypothetical protein